jgi:hypothetical protein
LSIEAGWDEILHSPPLHSALPSKDGVPFGDRVAAAIPRRALVGRARPSAGRGGHVPDTGTLVEGSSGMTEQDWLAGTDPGAMLRFVVNKLRDSEADLARLIHPITDYLLWPLEPDAWARVGYPTLPAQWLRGWIDSAACDPEDRTGDLRLVADLLLDVAGNPFGPASTLWRECDPCCGRGRWADGFQAELECPDCDGTGRRPTDVITPDVLGLAHAARDNYDPATGTLDPARLAVLADALEEAGCEAESVLRHLRGFERCWPCRVTATNGGTAKVALEEADKPDAKEWRPFFYPGCIDCHGTGWRPSPGPHVRGCWAVDLVLGKE